MPAVKRPQIERALRAADDTVRLYLLYGPDESGSRALGELIRESLGADIERVDLAPAALRQDPALLATEAAAISLFGGPRYIRVEGAGDESLAAIAALLEAPAAGNPAVLIAGALRKDSKLLTLATGNPAAMAFASYPPEGADADRRVAELARVAGLQLSRDAVRSVVADSGGDVAIAGREIEKLALFVDAAPDRPREIDDDAVALLGADSREGDLERLVELVLGGRPDAAGAELARLRCEGREGVPLLNAVARRLLQIAPIRAQVDEGNSVESAIGGARSLRRGDRSATSQVDQWRSDRIAAALDRVGAAQRGLRESGGAGGVIAEEALLALARGAGRRR